MRKIAVKPKKPVKKLVKKPVKKVTKAKVKKAIKLVRKVGPIIALPRQVEPSKVLRAGAQHMEDRASQYDRPEGERSMENTVKMFNILTGHNLTETEGWKFMSLLKLVRASTGPFKLDNYEDLVAYGALAAESHSVGK